MLNHVLYIEGTAVALRHEYDVIITSVWQSLSPNVVKAQPVHLSDYYYRLVAKMKARYLRKIAYIKSEVLSV